MRLKFFAVRVDGDISKRRKHVVLAVRYDEMKHELFIAGSVLFYEEMLSMLNLLGLEHVVDKRINWRLKFIATNVLPEMWDAGKALLERDGWMFEETSSFRRLSR